MNLRISYIFGINHTGVVVSVDQNSGIIYQNLLHLEDQICTFVFIHLALQLLEQCIIFRIGVSAVSGVGCPVCPECILFGQQEVAVKYL